MSDSTPGYLYRRVLEQRDYLQQELSLAQDEIKRLRIEIAIHKFRDLTVGIDRAIAAADDQAWARLAAERMQIASGIPAHVVDELLARKEAA